MQNPFVETSRFGNRRKPVRRPHWYFISVYACPVCGRGTETRERQYDGKPAEWSRRHEYYECYDGCLE